MLTSRCGNYQLPTRPLVQQRRQPIRFLNSGVKFPILLGEIVRFTLSRRYAHRTDELHFGTCRATLGRRGGSRKFAICVVADFQNVPFSEGIRYRPFSETRTGVGSVDPLNEQRQILRRFFQFGLQFDWILFRCIAFLNARVLDQPLLQCKRQRKYTIDECPYLLFRSTVSLKSIRLGTLSLLAVSKWYGHYLDDSEKAV